MKRALSILVGVAAAAFLFAAPAAAEPKSCATWCSGQTGQAWYSCVNSCYASGGY